MRRAASAAALAALLAALAPGPALAQLLPVPATLDVRADAAFPTGQFADVAGTGFGFSAGISVGVTPGIGVYGNYAHVRFGGGWTGDDPADATDDGFALGISALLPGVLAVDPWVGAGVLLHRLELEGSRTGISNDVGFELGGGIAVPVAGALRFSPAVSYRRYGATIDTTHPSAAAGSLTVQYVTLGVGLNIVF